MKLVQCTGPCLQVTCPHFSPGAGLFKWNEPVSNWQVLSLSLTIHSRPQEHSSHWSSCNSDLAQSALSHLQRMCSPLSYPIREGSILRRSKISCWGAPKYKHTFTATDFREEKKTTKDFRQLVQKADIWPAAMPQAVPNPLPRAMPQSQSAQSPFWGGTVAESYLLIMEST